MMPLPTIEPLRPIRRDIPLGREWVYEVKLDGFRGMLAIENGRGTFTSKNVNTMKRFQPLADALAHALPVESAILDGEIVVMGEEGRPDFYALFYQRGTPAYAAFDLLWLDGRDLREQPLWRRKKALQKLVAGTPVGYVDHVADPQIFVATAARDLEGIVAKRRNDPYAPETEWIKVKHFAYSQSEGRWELFDGKRR